MAREYILKSIQSGGHEEDGQPPSAFNAKFRRGREIDELLGICRGVLADGEVKEREAIYLSTWISVNEEVCSVWPANRIVARLARIFEDRIITSEELEDLRAMLSEVVGDQPQSMAGAVLTEKPNLKQPSALPLDNPEPDVEFPSKKFCFTGRFVAGTRSWCEAQVSSRGGMYVDRAKDSDYLVIGTSCSRDWAHSTHGRKIEEAMWRRNKGDWPKIVTEEHWSKFLNVPQVSEGIRFIDGFAEGYRIAIQECHKDSLLNREFEKGHVFYDAREAYTHSWNDALPKINMIVKITDESRDKVWFSVAVKDGPANFKESEVLNLPWIGFLAFLKTGKLQWAR